MDRIAEARALDMATYDYCPGRDASQALTRGPGHDPALALWHDRDMPAGYVTIECAACHQTTGVAFTMPDPQDIDWG